MLLNIITGGIGSGKSSYLYDLISKNLKNNKDARAILIVPEQFSYTAEKTLSEKMGGLGPNQIEALTFSRLIEQYMPPSKSVLPSGKMMLLSKAAGKASEDNFFFRITKKSGFIAEGAELFSEFKRYMITPDDLSDIKVENENTNKKLTSILEIYKNYTEAFPEGLADSDDFLGIFAEYVKSNNIFSDTFFFIDDYNDFMPGHYALIKALVHTSRGVFVTLSCSDENDELFEPVFKTKKRLITIAKSENAELYQKELSKTPDYIKSDEIRYMLTAWETKTPYTERTNDIRLFSARDLYSEVEHTASEIISYVRDHGYRFRDIGVICGNIGNYLHILSAVFADYNIPFFTDEKLEVTQHPVAKTVLSLFDILEENWSYRSVFEYLRTGYIYQKTEDGVCAIPFEDVDILENYVLKYGIKGKKAWFEPWTKLSETIFDEVIETRRKPDFDLEKLNELRKTIIAPFEHFLENKSRTVKAIASAVFDFMCDINLYQGILSECEALDLQGRRNEAEQFRQVWNVLIENLDQMVVTMGDDIISRENFSLYYKCGLSECGISIIPSGLDRVSVGTVERNSPSKVKILFIIGATYGAIPLIPETTGILSPLDRSLLGEALKSKDKELAPDDTERILLENIKLYRILSTATEKLSVSMPLSDSAGESLSQSGLIIRLKAIFPNISIYDNVLSKPTDTELLSSSKRGFYYMLLKLSEAYKEKPDALWQAVFNWYAEKSEYSDKLDILKTAAEFRKNQPKLSRARAELLYGNNKKYSITALEKFSKCPFSYYIERGLHAEPQEVKRVENSHIGSLIHAAVDHFCTIAEAGCKSITDIKNAWVNLSDERTNEIISNVISDMAKKVLPNIGNDEKRIAFLLSRCEKTLKRSADTIRKSLSSGGYVSVCREKGFSVKVNWRDDSVTLIGTIDRIDVMEDIFSKKANIRIVDYKSGSKSFNISAICNKIDMQLVLYAIAAASLYKKGEIEKTDASLSPQVSAIWYNKINDDFVNITKPDATLAKSKQKDEKKLDGVIVLDQDDDGNYKTDTLEKIDPDFFEQGTSDFLKVKLTTKGEFSSYSQVTSRKNFDTLCKLMKKTVIDTDRAIKNGVIDIRPVDSDKPCTYCEYKEICMFDENPNKFRHTISDKKEALQAAEKEVADDE